MKSVLFILLTIFSLELLSAEKFTSVYISFHDKSVLVTENICRDLFIFRKELQEKYPGVKVYPYILPKPVLEIEFDAKRLSMIFQTASGEKFDPLQEYRRALIKMFPDFEVTSSSDNSGIILTPGRCDFREDIHTRVKDIHIEHNGHRVGIILVSRIQLYQEDVPALLEKFQVELKILQGSQRVPYRVVKKYIKRMKTAGRYKHEIKIIRQAGAEEGVPGGTDLNK